MDTAARDKEPVYTTTTSIDRTFFLLDLHRLRSEGDTLENALVVYRPEADLKRHQYEQRCSQLVGLALCTMNYTSKFPTFVRLRGTGYAIRALGLRYIMCLSGRPDEPSTCAIHYLKQIADFFQFYYHSPAVVLKSSLQDWEIFTRTMASIFRHILRYLLDDQHSVPAMFNPLPHVKTTHPGKDGTRLYLQASRLLRACQQHYCIAGGCIMHNKAVLCSQLPPSLTEKLALVGGGGIELNSKSILEDNITPDKVWVIEVYLLQQEDLIVDDQRKDLEELQNAYSSLDSNPKLSSSALFWRFQSTKGPGWHRKGTQKNMPPSPSSPFSNPTLKLRSPSKKGDSPQTVSEADSDTHMPDPVASSTPAAHHAQPGTKNSRSNSWRSEDAVTISSTLNTVSYSPRNKRSQAHSTKNAPDSNPYNDYDSDLYDDFGDYVRANPVLPTSQSPLRLNPQSMSKGAGVGVKSEWTAGKSLETDGDALDSRPSTSSSEGFATPCPTPPKDGSAIMKAHLKALVSDSTTSLGLSGNAERSSSFLTACEFSMENSQLETGSEQSYLTQDGTTANSSASTEVNKMSLDDDQIQRLVNSAGSSSTSETQKTVSVVDSNVPPRPPKGVMANWGFKSEPVVDSDDDFVSSTELAKILDNLQGKSITTRGDEPGTEEEVKPPEEADTEDGDGADDERSTVPQVVVGDGLAQPEGNREEAETAENQRSLDVDRSDFITRSELQYLEGAITGIHREGESVDGDHEVHSLLVDSGQSGVMLQGTAPLTNGGLDDEDDIEGMDDRKGELPTSSGYVTPNGDAQEDAITTAVNHRPFSDCTSTSRQESRASDSPVTDNDSSSLPESDGGCATSGVQSEGHFKSFENGEEEQTHSRDPGSEVDALKDEGLEDEPESSMAYLGISDPPLDGTLTPVEMTLNITAPISSDSKLNDSGEYSSLPEEEDEGTEVSVGPSESSTTGQGTLKAGATTGWIQQTLGRQNVQQEKPQRQLEKKCLYVQRHMNTVVALLADTGLHQDHGLLSLLWQSLLPQLMDLEVGAKKNEEGRRGQETRQNNYIATFSNSERLCEAEPFTAAYHYRHALRRAHQEYQRDPSLFEIGLSKEHCRMFSQRVFDREVYFQPARLGHVDAITTHATIEKYTKVKQPHVQQPPNTPKVMFL